MKKLIPFIILGFCIFFASQLSEAFQNLLFWRQVIEYPTSVEVIKEARWGENITIGITTEPWNLNFGIIPAGSSGKRFLLLQNLEDRAGKVKLDAKGNISQMVGFSQNDFLLKGGKNLTITVSLNTKNTTKIGNYTGKIIIKIYKPKIDLFYVFLR